MTHRRALSVLWLLLPLLVARAMLPAGYMPEAGTQGMRLVMCSGALLATGDDQVPAQRAHGDLTCPFAQAATLAPPPDSRSFVATVIATVAPLPLQGRRVTDTGPPRQDRARGPPAHS